MSSDFFFLYSFVMDLNEILIFTKVIQAGSFNKAADLLAIPKSTVSSKVAALEKRLGVTLLHRTTRKITLTQAGETFFKNSLRHIEGLVATEAEASLNQIEPRGTLRMTAPLLFASSILPEVISQYMKKYPLVSFELIASDETTDLIGQNIDLAIRGGKLADSSLKMKKLGSTHFAPFASAKYIKDHAKILHPKDLLSHTCIQFTPLGKDHWEFIHKNKNRVRVSMTKKLLINELNVVKELALNDQGIALLPTFVCEKEIANHHLLRVLPEWFSEAKDVSFVYPADKYLPPKLVAFMNLSEAFIKQKLNASDKIFG